MKVERRTFPFQEIRLEDRAGKPPVIKGHAAVFDQLSTPMLGFREKIAPGAFRDSVKGGDDVRALFNHDPNYVLGRTKSGTLTLREDNRGLAVEIHPPDAQWAKDLLTTIRRGDVDQMSFGFKVIEDSYEGDGESRVRTLRKVELFDVSPVTYPAYPDTDVSVRAKHYAARKAEREKARAIELNRLDAMDELYS